jgi:hypothetical protein
MDEKTSAEAVGETRSAAEPGQAVPVVSAEVTTAFDPSKPKQSAQSNHAAECRERQVRTQP